MKQRKQYGIKEPKSLDYLLSFLCVMVGISALWIGIWVAATGTFAVAQNALGLMVDALAGNFVGANNILVLVQSVIIYGTALACLAFCVLASIKRKPRVLVGVFALLLAGFTLAIELGFVGLYILGNISGLFYVFLMVFMLAKLLLTYYTFKLTYAMLVKDCKLYRQYKEELGKKPEQKMFVVAKQETVKEEPKQAEKQESLLDIVENMPKDQEEELIFENSNEYRNYMYHDFLDKYVKEEQDIHEEFKQAEVEQPEENGMFNGLKAHNYTFEQKLKKAKPVVRQNFKEIKAYFEELGFKATLTKAGEIFTHKNIKYAMITTAGQKGLKIYYKLDVKDYENSTIPVKYVGDVKKYENVPLLFVAKSDLAVKRAKMLMDNVKAKLD